MKNLKAMLAIVLLSLTSIAWAGPVNVNTADAKTLAKELDGVGDKLAEAIVKEREEKGPFKDAADLAKRVKGIGDAIVEKNKANLRFSDK